ncbi:MAG: hypothetical protein HYV09_41695, partial [Deltaproteobacteria bacterium]|nr:hypothetical protein [Deltaproteobacteria bacterium]
MGTVAGRGAWGGWGRWMLQATLQALVAAIVAACSPHHDDAASTPDASASVAPIAERDEDARAIADAVRFAFASHAALSARFAAAPDGFQSTRDGIVSPGWRGAWTDRAHHVGARLPRSADLAFEAGVGVSELYRLSLTHLGARASTLAMDQGRGVYRDVYPSTDVTFVASPERLEWAYTLRDDAAPTAFQLKIALPKNLTRARIDARGGLELLDAEDHALLRIPRPLAIDAAGTTREATLAWDGAILTVTLDRSDLAFPIVLDPAVETVVWDQRVMSPGVRSAHAVAYDSIRKRIVMFGGYDGTTQVSQTWEWDGVLWSLRSTVGPSARQETAMAFDSARGFTVLFGGNSYTNDTWEWDGTTWYQRCTTTPCSSTRPAGRSAAAMAYDATRAKIVLFGGHYGSTYYSDTWLWNGTAWTTGPAGPSARRSSGMTWDSTQSRVLLFGGQTDTSTYFNDLWSYNGTSWSAVSTSGGPPQARSKFAFAFRNGGRAVLFGGSFGGSSADRLGDTWELVSSTNAWVSIGGTGPSSRFDTAAAYDSSRQAVVLFGGTMGARIGDTWEYLSGIWRRPANDVGERTGPASAFDSFRNRVVLFGGYSYAGGFLGDTWEWDGYAWNQLCTTAPCSTTKPAARQSAVAAYDSDRKRFVLFGGNPTSDLWEFDGTTWVQKCTALPCTSLMPSGRYNAAAAYDSTRKRTVLFGGYSGGTTVNDTWEWDGNAWTRPCAALPCSATVPSARSGAVATFDPDRSRVVLFGGSSGGVALGDTWEFSGSAWSQVATTGPLPRYAAGLAYDRVRKKTVLFGGRPASGGPFGDTWEWDGASWTQTATTGPQARREMALDYDAARRRVVMFGGTTGTAFFFNNGETWEYYTRGGACSIGTQCATGFCVDGVCCEQLSCGTCQACDVAGSPGKCAPVIGADDTDTCAAATSTCDATGACKLKQAQSCTSNTQCASGSCANNYCCDQACTGGCDVCNSTPGTCTKLTKYATGSNPSCGPYLCDGLSGECPASCANDNDCATGYFCAAGGICQARRPQGAPCNTASGGDCLTADCRECTSGLTCKDGYCCNNPCAGGCQTCAATPGLCTTLTNAKDPDTCSGVNTCSASGSCLLENGQTCTLASQCASGSCADGVCCNTACAGGCDVCNATAGTCTIAAQGSVGSPSCGAYVCNGSLPACPSTCGNDSDCAATHYCAASGTCQLRKSQGATCNQSTGVDCKSDGCRVCATGNCIDGYCCNSTCGNACDACNGATRGWSGATNGTCAIAPASFPGVPACGSYACNGTSATCAATCTSDAQCGTGYYCNAAGACVAQKAQGASCNLAADCKSGSCRACATGNCVDGYCCNTACGGQCQACDVTGALGTCVTVTGAVHVNVAIPARTACPGTGACAASCN